jgi:hypothetical protein
VVVMLFPFSNQTSFRRRLRLPEDSSSEFAIIAALAQFRNGIRGFANDMGYDVIANPFIDGHLQPLLTEISRGA